jgi:hypothetical protein
VDPHVVKTRGGESYVFIREEAEEETSQKERKRRGMVAFSQLLDYNLQTQF